MIALSQQGEQIGVEYYVQIHPVHVPIGLGWIVDILTEKSVSVVIETPRERVRKQPSP